MLKILTFHPFYNLDPGFVDREVWMISQTISRSKKDTNEVWCLKKNLQENLFEMKNQIKIYND